MYISWLFLFQLFVLTLKTSLDSKKGNTCDNNADSIVTAWSFHAQLSTRWKFLKPNQSKVLYGKSGNVSSIWNQHHKHTKTKCFFWSTWSCFWIQNQCFLCKYVCWAMGGTWLLVLCCYTTLLLYSQSIGIFLNDDTFGTFSVGTWLVFQLGHASSCDIRFRYWISCVDFSCDTTLLCHRNNIFYCKWNNWVQVSSPVSSNDNDIYSI